MYNSGGVTSELYFAVKNAISVASRSFSGVSIEGGSLVNADLWAVELNDSMFEDVNLSGAKFGSAVLDYVCFRNCDLREADFTQAQGSTLVFIGCNLEGTLFTGAVLDECFFSECEGAVNFSAAALNGSRFLRCDLQLSDFGGADLSNTEFEGGDISYSTITKHTLVSDLTLRQNVDITNVELSLAIGADTISYEEVIVEPYEDTSVPKVKVSVIDEHPRHLGEVLPAKTHLPVVIRPATKGLSQVNYSIYAGVDRRAHLFCSDMEEFKSNQ